MTAHHLLLAQRSEGHAAIRMGRSGVEVLREEGSSKLRLPRGSSEAILINTSGGLAGGDLVTVDVETAANAALTVTNQAAERVYRTLGPAAEVRVSLKADGGARLHWLPQETILFENAALSRRLDVTLAEDAEFLGVESVVLGRAQSGETVSRLSLRDHWNLCVGGKLVHAERLRLGPERPASAATLEGAGAFATLLFVSSTAESRLAGVCGALSESDGASAWNGKLVARLLARDGFELRKRLLQVVMAVAGRSALPKLWTM